MNLDRKKKIAKIAVIVLSVLLVAGGCALWWFSVTYKKVLREKLPVWVMRTSDSLYHISVADVSINLFTDQIKISNARLWPDSSRLAQMIAEGSQPAATFTVDVPYVVAKGISWTSLIAEKEFSCDRFIISHPRFMVTSQPESNMPKQHKDADVTRIRAGYIELLQPYAVYKNHSNDDSAINIMKGGQIVIKDWLFDPQAANNDRKLIYGKLGMLDADTLTFSVSNSLYRISMGHIHIAEGDTATISHFRLLSAYDRQSFYRHIGHQKDLFNIYFPQVRIAGFDAGLLLDKKTIKAKDITLATPSISLYYDRIPAPDTQSKMGNYPNQILRKIPLHIDIDSMHILNGHFRYTERNPVTMREGSFSMDDVNGYARQITNMPQRLTIDNDCVIALRGKFMQQSPIEAVFRLDLKDTTGKFAVDGRLYDLQASQIQDMTKALALADITSMYVDSIIFNVSGDQSSIQGNMRMLYHDLHVNLMKADAETADMKTMGLASFIANAALIYNDNPEPDGMERVAAMSQIRNPQRSFFNLIWKTLFQGITDIALRNHEMAEMIQQADPERGKRVKQLKKNVKKLKKAFHRLGKLGN